MRCRKSRYLLAPLAALLLLAALAWPAASPAVVILPPVTYYRGVWQGQTVNLTHVTNITVEGLPDATLIGQIANFQTDDSYYTALNGESINVWSAPAEFPGDYVVHNGDQGTQSVYGTWTFPAAKENPTMTVSASPNPVGSGQYTYVTLKLSQPVSDGTVSVTGEGTTLTGTPANGTWVSGGFGEVVAGSYTFNASWSGDNQYNPASGSTTVTVTGGPTKPYSVTLSASPASLPADGTSTAIVTATVTGANGQPVPDDSVDFTAADGTVPAAVQTNGNGQATATYTAGTTPGSVAIAGKEVIDSASGGTTVTLTAPSYTYTGSYSGQTVTLTPVSPISGLFPAHTQMQNFQTNNPALTQFNGQNLDVYGSQSLYPALAVVAGNQDFTFTPPAQNYTYTGTFNGQTVTLTRVTNVTVEGLPDETLLSTQLDNFQTNDPYYKALNGENINVFTAPAEFAGVDVVHNGLMGTQSVYGTWTFTPPSSTGTVAALKVSVASPQDFGNPFTFIVTAADAAGNPVTTDNDTIDLTSSTNNVDFTSATTSPGQPVTVQLVNGTATVHAQDPVIETTTITATDAAQAGVSGSAQLSVVMTPHPLLWTPGVDLSINGGPSQRVGDINFIDYLNGVNQNGCHGGYWPLGVGKTYTAAWTGTLWIPWAGTYQFRNTSDDSATAAITVGGQTVAIPENSWTAGTNPPVSLQLQRGYYTVSVSQQETDGQGGAGDTLQWQPFWRSSLVPIPAFFWRSGQTPPNILPSSISFTIGSDQYVADGTSQTVDTAPFIQDGRTYLAVRDMGYAIGMSNSDITWIVGLKTATFSFDGHAVSFTLGSDFLKLDGVEKPMDVPPIDLNGRIYVPARYFANAFGYQVHWDAQVQKVRLTPPSGTGNIITWGGPIGTNGKGNG